MISVIVPIYNVEKYLAECLESIAAQSYTDFEVIMVDDGSTDTSPRIAADFAARDPRFILITKPNGGQSSARNAGIDAAHGDFFMFVDADDALHPEAIEIMFEPFQKAEEGLDMSTTDIRWTRTPQYSVAHGYEIFSGQDALENTLYQKPFFHNGPYARLISKDALRRTGKFTEGIIYEDLEYCSRLYAHCPKVAVSHAVLYFYRKQPESAMNTWSPKRLDVLDVVDAIERRLRHADKSLYGAACSRRFSAYFNMYLLSCANSYTAGADRCWPVIRQLRARMLRDPKVRLKNKAGALLSYLGPRLTSLFSHL